MRPSACTVPAAASRAVSARRASPLARRSRWSRASASSVTAPPSPRSEVSARSTSRPIAASSRGCRVSSRLRDSSGETIEKNGFSVVAATRVTCRASTAASSESCWVLLKRWISSMNSTVCRPVCVSSDLARAMTSRTSLTPALSADSCAKRRLVALETISASVVLPGAGRPEQDQRHRRVALDQPAQRRARARAGGPARRPRPGCAGACGRRAARSGRRARRRPRPRRGRPRRSRTASPSQLRRPVPR